MIIRSEQWEGERTAMTPRGALALALALVAVSAVAAGAQTLPWPSSAPPQAQRQPPWPSSAPPNQPMAMPSPGMPMGAPQSGMPPNAQACLAGFNSRREDVEKHALAARTGGEKHVSREEMCKLVGA